MKDPPPVAQPVSNSPLRQPEPGPLLVQPVAGTPQIQYVNLEVHAPVTQRQESGFGGTVRTLGVIALSFMLVGLIPCLGWLNYLNIAFSFVTIVIGIVALANAKSETERTAAMLGVALVALAIVLGTARLILGGGCL
jgi:hypothetical protein